MRNKIRHIGLSERAVHGDADPPLPFRGIQNIVVIGIGDPEDDGVPVMLKMLDWMMCEGYSRDERRKGLMGLGLTVTKDMEDNILRMNSIDEDRDRRMRDAGREEGRAEERKILMPVLASTVRAFMEDNGLSVEEAVVRARIPEDIRDDIISALSQSSNRNKWTVADMAGYNLRMNSIDEDRDRRMRDEGREEGRALGREEGRALGRAEAKAEMRSVLVSVLTNVARALMEDHGWTVEEALARLNVPDYVRDDVISALG
jgi:predicted transposase YdaD